MFGDHRSGLSEHWQAKTDRVTASEREAFQRMVAESKHQAELEERKRHEAAELKAVAILEAATGDPETHPYAVKKRVPLGALVKRGPWPQRGWGDALLVPICGADGRVWSIEAINADRKKDSLKDGDKRGGFHPFGKVRGASRVFIAEGVANAAVGAEVDKSPAVAAMGKSNIHHVALAVRELAPDAELIILADNDLKFPKEAHEAAVAVGGRVVLPELDGRKCDLWDVWNERGIEAVSSAIANAQAPGVVKQQPGAESFPVAYRRVSDVQAKPIRWLWPDRIARGKVSMLAGHPGLGKSQVTASMAAIVTTGGTWPADRTPCERGNVIILSGEDDAEDTIRPRLEAAGANLEWCYTLDAVRDTDRNGAAVARAFNLKRDLTRLGALLAEIGDVALVIIAPVSAYLGDTDSHKNAEVRGLMTPLGELAARYGAAVVCISHLSKGGNNEALMRVTGSLAFVAAARAAYIIAKNQDDPARRLFLPIKNNLGDDQTGLAFSIQSAQVDSPIGLIETSRVMWESDHVTITADEAMTPQADPEERSDLDDCKEFLRGLLSDGPVPSKQVRADADGGRPFMGDGRSLPRCSWYRRGYLPGTPKPGGRGRHRGRAISPCIPSTPTPGALQRVSA